MCLQETKLVDAKFPRLELAAAGYSAHFVGQNTYNGVALIVARRRRPRSKTSRWALPDFADEQKRVIAATVAGVRIVDFYVPNGQTVDSDKYRYKLEWCRAARRILHARANRTIPRLVVAGDFNIAPEDRDVHDPDLWRGQVLCSEPERQVFRDWHRLGMRDSFRLFEQPREDVQLVGLPAARVSEEPRLAHRPHPASLRRSRRAARRAASTAMRARANGHRTTRR